MKTQFASRFLYVWESRFFRTTTSYIPIGSSCLVVDPNLTSSELEGIAAFVHQRHQPGDVFLFFTHSDFDHIAGARYFPEARKIGSGLFDSPVLRQKARSEWIQFDQENQFPGSHGYPFPALDIRLVREKHTLRIGHADVLFRHVPGHTADSYAALLPAQQLMIAGDYLSNIEIPLVEHDVDAYSNTLELFENMICQCQIEYLVPGHGDIAIDRHDMEKRILFAKEYLSELIAADHVSLEEIVMKWGMIYPPIESVRAFHRDNLEMVA